MDLVMIQYRVGFTGTHTGMSVPQREFVRTIFESLTPIAFHHGDCIGADAQAHDIAESLNIPIVIHPPTIAAKRAFKPSQFIEPEYPYLVRNRHIVDAVDVMIATPKGYSEELRSGTWAAIRYTKKQNKPLLIVWPDGTTVTFG